MATENVDGKVSFLAFLIVCVVLVILTNVITGFSFYDVGYRDGELVGWYKAQSLCAPSK